MKPHSRRLMLFSFAIDDDYVDRLNHFLTSVLLFLGVIISSKTQYFGKPISCWTPKIFTKAHVEYAENMCWVKSTYTHRLTDLHLPRTDEERSRTAVIYYQWVPFFLFTQALLFQIPNFIWCALHDHSGFRLRYILETASDVGPDPEQRRAASKVVALHMADYIRLRMEGRMDTRCARAKRFCARYLPLICSRSVGNYLAAFYLLSKALYMVNLSAQLHFMAVYLGAGQSHFYGLNVIANLTLGRFWSETKQFPRVTFCDFYVRMVGNLHRHTLQCVLPINRLNEKIYLVLWLWFYLLIAMTALNLLRWTGRLYVARVRKAFVRDLLNYVGGLTEQKALANGGHARQEHDWLFKGFMERYLALDGVLILHLLAHNAGQMVTSEIVADLWRCYEKDVRAWASGGGPRPLGGPLGEEEEEEVQEGTPRTIPRRRIGFEETAML